MHTIFAKAAPFIYRNARPLDLARFQYHFEGGSQAAVLQCLSYYQNADGGFGHALEADAWNPHSAPIQTWTATEILREINCTDAAHPIMQGILRYLTSEQDFDGTVWQNVVKSNNDYPHAPWWTAGDKGTSHEDYNPTACLAGFLIRFAAQDSVGFALGCRIAQESYAQLMRAEQNDMHTLACYIRLYEYCKEAGVADVIDLAAMEQRLITQVKNCITQDLAEWESSYICKPSQFFNTPDSVFYQDNCELAAYECTYIARKQMDDGTWDIPWDWGAYPEEWAIAKSWWKATVIINNLLYLRGMQK